jgi:outer membrane protein OmpA-like peptidoglycan-associated protein
MEERLGHDFASVRIHDGAKSEASAAAVGAEAYTVGHDVVFAPGRYQPQSDAGQRLLAHELVHVVQQGGKETGSLAGNSIAVSPSGDRPERDADAAVDRPPHAGLLLGAIPGMTPALATLTLQRQEIVPEPGPTLRLSPLLERAIGAETFDGFALNSAELTPEHRVRLAELAARMLEIQAENPGNKVDVLGHTDRTGGEEHNERLGQQRADAVAAVLAALGVPTEIMRVRSLGETVPLVETERPEPRNRRVEVYFLPIPRPVMPGLLGERLRPPELAPVPPAGEGGGIDILRPDPCLLLPELCYGERGPRRPPQPDIFRPLPEIPPRRGRSVAGAFGEALDRGLDRLMGDLGIPASVRPLIKRGARAAVEKGAQALLDNALDEAGITGEEREAIQNAVRAAAQTEVR